MNSTIKTKFFKLTGVKVRSIEFLQTGFSNLNYKINDSYVLRLCPEYRDPSLSYSNELDAYEQIKDLCISEKIVYFSKSTGIKISRFVHNSRPYVQYPTKIEIAQIAKVLKKLHTSKKVVSHSYEYEKKLNLYKKDLPSYLLIDSNTEQKIIDEYNYRLKKDKKVLCHNDLVKNNMLFKYNGVTLIDWEYASMNSPYFDLASFISENNLLQKDAVFFLSKYFGYQYTTSKKNIVEEYIKAQDLLFYYWAQHMFIKKGDALYITIANDKLARINSTY